MKTMNSFKKFAGIALPALLIAGCSQLSAEDKATLEEIRMTAQEASDQASQAASDARAAR
jgi:PBP1b-binding outer membrane lipoprotein LpoB